MCSDAFVLIFDIGPIVNQNRKSLQSSVVHSELINNDWWAMSNLVENQKPFVTWKLCLIWFLKAYIRASMHTIDINYFFAIFIAEDFQLQLDFPSTAFHQ